MSCLHELGFREKYKRIGEVKTRLGRLQQSLWWIEERDFREVSCMSGLPILHDLLRRCRWVKEPDGARCGRESLLDEQGESEERTGWIYLTVLPPHCEAVVGCVRALTSPVNVKPPQGRRYPNLLRPGINLNLNVKETENTTHRSR